MNWLLSPILCILALLPSTPLRAADSREHLRPNILVITADNLGYGDLRCFNSDSPIKTPNLNRLAAEGVRLTSFYTASPTCTVSRASLLTGRIPQRHGLNHQLPGIEGNYGVGLDQREILIPQILKTAPTPYVSSCFGKWNIGFAAGSRPTERGFDMFLGHASGNMDYYHHIYNGRHDLFRGTDEFHADGTYSTDLFADAAIEFVRRESEAGRPWFCYLPFNAPHFPNAKNKKPGQLVRWQAPANVLARYGLSPDETDPKNRYAAVVTALDESIGRVLDALKTVGVADNTFVFFYSDNGAFRLGRRGIDVGSNRPLRDGGVTCWEGGLRVAALARWPGRIPAGSTVSEPLWSPDLLTACTGLSGAEIPKDRIYDGKDPLPVLTDGAVSPHESFYFEYRGHRALRKGDWKIVRESPAQPWQLFNLAEDVGETTDLASALPERVAELKASLTDWQRSFRP